MTPESKHLHLNEPAHSSSAAGSLFLDYELPTERIAQEPIEPRDASKLLVVPRNGAPFEDRVFTDLSNQLKKGDLVVMNTSQVLPARIRGTREATGGKWEALFVREHSGNVWECLAKTKGKPALGEWMVTDCGDQSTGQVAGHPASARTRPLVAETGRLYAPSSLHSQRCGQT